MGKVIISQGDVFCKLTTVDRITKNGRAYWHCVCECGNEKDIREDALQSGATKSCGCYQKQQASKSSKKHGMRDTTEYTTWYSMKARCLSPNHKSFSRYGGRGVTICDEWINSFESFFADMGPKPVGTSLDRIDNAGNYCKDNCRWATRTEQQRNIRSNSNLTFKGETKCMAEWCEELGLSYSAVCYRINETGMSVEEAFTKPVKRRPLLTHGGQTKFLADWAAEYNMTYDTLLKRIEKMSVEEALARPTRKSRNFEVTFNGKTQLLRDWAKELGLEFNTLWLRLKTMSMDEALTMPPRSKK